MELEKIMSENERTVLKLRRLFLENGYRRYRMGRFEEYDFYAENRDFLPSGKIMTFTDGDGKLMAMKPDVTLSILRNLKVTKEREKLFYNENVYRPDPVTGCYREIMQMGAECIGKVDERLIAEVITLASKSLGVVPEENVIAVSDLDIIGDVLKDVPADVRREIVSEMGKKSVHGVRKVCKERGVAEADEKRIIAILQVSGGLKDAAKELGEIGLGEKGKAALWRLERVGEYLEDAESAGRVTVDFSIVDDTDYYSGIIFRGYIKGVSKKVISGGCYDNLMRKMKREGSAIGFAIYFESLEGAGVESRCGAEKEASCVKNGKCSENGKDAERENKRTEKNGNNVKEPLITVALPKGRLGKDAYSKMEDAGYGCEGVMSDSRQLIFENKELRIRYFWSKPSDVGIYVEHGAADIGIAGKDILAEQGSDVYELLDLGIGKCRLAVAGKDDYEEKENLVVATKFPNSARKHFMEKGKNIDIIGLNGSIELAPILGLSDVIVDIVETGTTLKKNNLHVIEEIFDISARLVANKGSWEFKKDRIKEIAAGLAGTEKPTGGGGAGKEGPGAAEKRAAGNGEIR